MKYYDKEEKLFHKLLIFYVIYTCIYFSILLICLFWSASIYNVGKYSFQSIITIIIVAELTKYFASVIHFNLVDVNLSRKPDESITFKIIKSFFSRSKILEGFKNVIIFIIATFVYAVLAILFGAEAFTKHEETLMFSVLMTVLTVLPTCVNLGIGTFQSMLASKPIDSMGKLMYLNCQLTIFGAWLGAFVIPLDWDRPWQEWPISCSTGAMIGFLLSHLIRLSQIIPFRKSQGNKTK